MPTNPYVIHYAQHPEVSFPTVSGMRSYLGHERAAWQPFLDELPSILMTEVPLRHNNSISADSLSTAFDILESHLENSASFNECTSTARYGTGLVLPPKSDSDEGVLILALFHAGKLSKAVSVYLNFIAVNFLAQVDRIDDYSRMASQGVRLLEAASVATVLPFSKVSSAKLAGAVRRAESHYTSLEQEVARAAKVNDAHESRLNEVLQQQRQRGSRLNLAIRRLSKRRAHHIDEWKLKITTQVSESFDAADKRIGGMERLSQIKLQKQEEEFRHLQDLFATQLRLRAPVKLWEGRENKHSTNSNAALLRLFIFGAITAIIAIVVPVFAGDYIAGSFFEIVCSPGGVVGEAELSCERYFSAKGPLTVTGLLLAMSILAWITRLQYRIHLSERHLSLDASEKKAFAETYLAMKEGEDVGQANEAIVLASLFRPTQDGIIRDDETGMDLSAVALLAKQLGKSNP